MAMRLSEGERVAGHSKGAAGNGQVGGESCHVHDLRARLHERLARAAASCNLSSPAGSEARPDANSAGYKLEKRYVNTPGNLQVNEVETARRLH
jgi:hypothetical protein